MVFIIKSVADKKSHLYAIVIDTAFGSLNVIANLFQTLGKGLKRQDSGK